MALVVFLRGVNVGGHRTFRPSLVARELSEFDVLNIGAAGTFVVRKPVSAMKFRAALLRKLGFDAHVAICEGRDLIDIFHDNPFGTKASAPDVVRFVSILVEECSVRLSMPVALPAEGAWLVRLLSHKNQFVFGEYRRHMKTIGYLGQIDKLFCQKVTTRNWNTIKAIVRILEDRPSSAPRKSR
jgi:uncharacterized protein (DUF1697 family)